MPRAKTNGPEWREIGKALHELRTPSCRVTLSRLGPENSSAWFVSCSDLDIEDVRLDSKDLPLAKREGLNKVLDLLTQWAAEVSKCIATVQ
jgi:hypothetical protein